MTLCLVSRAIQPTDEDSFVERKTFGDIKDVLKTAVAFANSAPIGYPAVLYVGVANDGIIQRLKDLNIETLQDTVMDKIRAAYPTIYAWPVVLRHEAMPFLATVIPGSAARPHFSGQAFVRNGTRSESASDEQYQMLIAERQSRSYELRKWLGEQIVKRHIWGDPNGPNRADTVMQLVDATQF